jgi:alpha-tubulin suppressor-like RCC1 family protein
VLLGAAAYAAIGTSTANAGGESRPTLSHAIAISSGGGDHTCALVDDGTVACWGANDAGQLGRHGRRDSLVARPVRGVDDVVGVAVGGRHTCALRVDQTVWCWGANDRGQLGRGTVDDRPHPTPKETVSLRLSGTVFGTPWTFAPDAIVAGGEHTCVRGTPTSFGLCWGGGSGEPTIAGHLPTSQTPFFSVSDFTAGRAHVCFREQIIFTGTGLVTFVCQGADNRGQISLQPAPTALESFVDDLVAGGDSTCATIDEPGFPFGPEMRCWGANDFGQLNDGTTSSGPVVSRAIPDVLGPHSCRVTDSGIECWGRNDRGQLGNGTFTSSFDATPVRGIETAVAVTRGASHTCALDVAGTVRCWGANDRGQLGDGTRSDAPIPTLVLARRQ